MFLSVAWPRGLKHRFYGDRVIATAWSRFNSHPLCTRCCVLGYMGVGSGRQRGPWPPLDFQTWYNTVDRGLNVLFSTFFVLTLYC